MGSIADAMFGKTLFCKNAHLDGLVQEMGNSIANALELCLSCINPLIWYQRN